MLKKALVLFVIALGIVGSAAAQDNTALTAALSGANEVAPAVGDPDGSGTMNLLLKPNQGQICYDLTLQNVDGVTRAHIHEAPAGVNGPVVVSFFDIIVDPSDQIIFNDCTAVDPALINAIANNPAAYYINIHSEDFPPGAVRGQLELDRSGSYIQINNSNISVTRNEQPSIVSQLGNRSQATLTNVGVVCGWNGGIRVNFRTQNGPFGEPTLFTPPQTAGTVNEGFAVFVWENAVDLRPGQNFNVAFGLNLTAATDPGFTGQAGIVVCWLTDGAGVDAPRIASSGPIPVVIR